MSLQQRHVLAPSNESLTGFASNVTAGSWTLTATSVPDGLAHQVSIRNDSATDHSAKTVILRGTGPNGYPLTETINLPGTSATVESTEYFQTLTSVVPSATIGADTMDIGWVDEVAKIVMLNHKNDTGAYIQVDIGGTLNYDIEVTFAERQYIEDGTAQWVNSGTTALVNATADKMGQIEIQATAFRFVTNSYSSGATITLYVAEATFEG